MQSIESIEYASGFKEYYNLSTDPYEMTSTPGSAPASVVDRLQRLKTCAGATCRSIENEDGGTPPPPPPDDTTPPKVESNVPADGATGVSPTVNVTAAFSEDMLSSSINGNTFKLSKKGSTTKLTATVSYEAANKTATLNPTNSLQRGVTYKAVVTTGAKDVAGNSLDQNSLTTGLQQKAWLFTVS